MTQIISELYELEITYSVEDSCGSPSRCDNHEEEVSHPLPDYFKLDDIDEHGHFDTKNLPEYIKDYWCRDEYDNYRKPIKARIVEKNIPLKEKLKFLQKYSKIEESDSDEKSDSCEYYDSD